MAAPATCDGERACSAHISQLDPPEITIESQVNASATLYADDLNTSCATFPRADLITVNWRHSGWAPTRTRVWRALNDAGVSGSRLDRFEECGLHAWVLESVTEPGTYRLASDKCHDRFCLPCGQERSRTIASNVIAHLRKREARFLTLTLKARQEPLAHTITRLYKAFARLRQRKFWKQKAKGGVAFLEVKRSKDRNHWHVHLHALVQGRYMDKRVLSRTWHAITGDSYVIDIRQVKNPDEATHYVAKYASKPLDPTATREPTALAECVAALQHRRLCLTFGSWQGIELTTAPDTGEWVSLVSLEQLLTDAKAGHPESRQILEQLRSPTKCHKSRSPPKNCTPGNDPGQLRLPWNDAPYALIAAPF